MRNDEVIDSSASCSDILAGGWDGSNCVLSVGGGMVTLEKVLELISLRQVTLQDLEQHYVEKEQKDFANMCKGAVKELQNIRMVLLINKGRANESNRYGAQRV